jgi:hypothetical protein
MAGWIHDGRTRARFQAWFLRTRQRNEDHGIPLSTIANAFDAMYFESEQVTYRDAPYLGVLVSTG